MCGDALLFPGSSMTMKTILFICTGNVFRSFTAELALAREIDRQGLGDTFQAASAGTGTGGAYIVPDLYDIWADRGLDPGEHHPRPVKQDILDEAAAIISMATNHQETLLSEFGCESLLYNQLANGDDRSVDDVGEALPDYRESPEAVRRFMEDTVDHIINSTPALLNAVGGTQA